MQDHQIEQKSVFVTADRNRRRPGRQRLYGMCICLALCFVLVAPQPSVVAQDEPNFTIASIKPSADNDPGMVVQQLPNGGYSGRKIPLVALLTSAYGISPERIIGAPNWWKTDRYDIEARYEPRDRAVPPLNVLLQGLLRERFGLIAHMEKRDFPVYVLRTIAKDGKLGPGVKPSSAACPAAPINSRDANSRAANGAPLCGAIERPDAFIASGVTMDTVARALRVPAGRDVINDAGLLGTWDVTLEFASPTDTSGEKPSIFTAIKDGLNLKLDSATAPVDVLVVDAAARPTPN
jgi:uncharacterized protein (TIGR03435 family)